jgi:signal transduction histidine kinase
LLAVTALIGSVVIPGRQTWEILALLRQTTEGLAPAKILTAELQTGLVEEAAFLRPPASAGDPGERFHIVVERNTLRLDSLGHIGQHLDSASRLAILDVTSRVLSWRAAMPRVELSTNARIHEDRLQSALVRHDSAQLALADLSSGLASETTRRNQRVQRLERLSLGWNIVLVITAFAGLAAVIVLVTRDRHALADAERRSGRDVNLREAAEAMAGAFNFADLMHSIANAAYRIADGRGAFITRVLPGSAAGMVVDATSGTGTPAPGTTNDLGAALVATALHTGTPTIIPPSPATIGLAGDDESLLVVPLGNAMHPIGAVVVLSGPRGRFRADDVAYAGLFGHLASLAFEKLRVLDEAKEGRQKLERVLASRSRLMRGFSHDVKNPVGAADGYGALLQEGIYGKLSHQQTEAVDRIRRSLHGALALIDDLHELARAESGWLAVVREPVDVNALVGEIALEYQAAAHSARLDLHTSLHADSAQVMTSGVRVRQVVANLLSNAIKYTLRGSITVETRVHDSDPEGVPGDWIQILVSDTGPGIPAGQQEFIFEEFSRIGPRDKPGAGLGLAISRLVAGALGGHLTVDSEMGLGSRFILWLPLTNTPIVNERTV